MVVVLMFLCSWHSWTGNETEVGVGTAPLRADSSWLTETDEKPSFPRQSSFHQTIITLWIYNSILRMNTIKYAVWQEGGSLVGQQERRAKKKVLKVDKPSL